MWPRDLICVTTWPNLCDHVTRYQRNVTTSTHTSSWTTTTDTSRRFQFTAGLCCLLSTSPPEPYSLGRVLLDRPHTSLSDWLIPVTLLWDGHQCTLVILVSLIFLLFRSELCHFAQYRIRYSTFVEQQYEFQVILPLFLCSPYSQLTYCFVQLRETSWSALPPGSLPEQTVYSSIWLSQPNLVNPHGELTLLPVRTLSKSTTFLKMLLEKSSISDALIP